ncbi:MAG: hypothetical protein ABIK09_15075 [Pseudomonadota bacterium]
MPARFVTIPLLILIAACVALSQAACGDSGSTAPGDLTPSDVGDGDFLWTPPDVVNPKDTDGDGDQPPWDAGDVDAADPDGLGDADADSPDVKQGCSKDSDCTGAQIPMGPCQRPVCNSHLGLCVPGPAAPGEACDDDNLCTIAERCDEQGICVGVPVICDDGNLCTTDSCDGNIGCVYQHNQNNCDDGNGCTTPDKCVEGTCTGEVTAACDCGDDSDCEVFDDGSLCNGQVKCMFGTCKVSGLTVVECDTSEDTTCVKTLCVPKTGACVTQTLGDGRPCDDQDLCSLGDICLQGICTPSAPRSCDDANPCTIDTCTPQKGCLHAFTAAWPCDDGAGCTVGDFCDTGACVPGPGNACLDHTCYSDWPLVCGTSDTWNTAGDGSTTNIDAWPCGPGEAFPGPEYTYVFVPVSDGPATLTLDVPEGAAAAFVLEASGEGCEAVNCRHRVDGELTFDAFAGSAYYIVVDAAGSEGVDYSISLDCASWEESACADAVDNDLDGLADCEDPDCQGGPDCPAAICSPVWSLECNTSDVGTNYGVGSTGGIITYRDVGANKGCLDNSWEYTGPEFTYRFEAPTDLNVTVRLFEESAQTDLLILEDKGQGCVPTDCVAWGLKKVTFPAKEGHTYFFVVDGYGGAKGGFGIELSCPLITETKCDDGQDNDLDGLSDCLDTDCAGAPFCQGVCVPTREAWCGFAEGFSNMGWGSTHNVSKYPQCNSYTYSGPEITYRFTAPYDTTLSVKLALETASTDLLILGEDCDPTSCLAAGMDTVAFPVEGGETYSVVVDGYNAAVGTYLIAFDCTSEDEVLCNDGEDNDADGLVDCLDEEDCTTDPACPKCSPKDVLTCGESDTWTTADSDATDVVTDYTCNANTYDGPEYTYEYTADASGQVTVTLSSESGPTDVLVLENDGWGCSPVHCIAWGPSTATFDVIKTHTYFIVVDGHGKAPAGAPATFGVGAYTIGLTCDD